MKASTRPEDDRVEVHMELCRVIIAETSEEQVIVLKEADGERSFPIVIGIFEAAAIDRKLHKAQPQRPLTHDLLDSVIRGLNASVERIVVTDLKEGTFYAKIVLKHNGQKIDVDSRPSDAIALSIYNKAPIYVDDSVLKEVCPG